MVDALAGLVTVVCRFATVISIWINQLVVTENLQALRNWEVQYIRLYPRR